jgi:hypothetical protein
MKYKVPLQCRKTDVAYLGDPSPSVANKTTQGPKTNLNFKKRKNKIPLTYHGDKQSSKQVNHSSKK